MKKYDFEYQYHLNEEDASSLQNELRVSYRLEFVVFLLEYEVEENNNFFALNNTREEILYVLDTDGIRVDLDKRPKFIVGDYVHDFDLYKAKCNHWFHMTYGIPYD